MFTPARRARARSRRRSRAGSRTVTRSSLTRAAGELDLQQAAAVLARARRCQRATRVARRRARISSAASRRRSAAASISRATASRLAAKMSRPDRRVRAGDAGRVAKARADLGQALGLLHRAPRRPADEHVGEHVRQVADRRHQPVVGLGVDRLRARAQVRDGPLEAVVDGRRSSARSASGTSGRPRTGRRARSRRPRVSAPASGWPPMKRRSRSSSGSAGDRARAWSSRRR